MCGWHSSILPGTGLLGGSTILRLEQLLFDMEMFRGENKSAAVTRLKQKDIFITPGFLDTFDEELRKKQGTPSE